MIRAHYNINCQQLELFAFKDKYDSRGQLSDIRLAAQPVVYIEHSPHESMLPTISVPDNEAQRLMDDLWNAGFRPSESKHVSDILKSKESHIEDLRTIAFHTLKIRNKE